MGLDIVMLAFLGLIAWAFYLDHKQSDNAQKILQDLLVELRRERDEQ